MKLPELTGLHSKFMEYFVQQPRNTRIVLLKHFLSSLPLSDIWVALEEKIAEHKKEVMWNSTPPSKFLN